MIEDRIAEYRRKANSPIKYILLLILILVVITLLSFSAATIKIGVFESFDIIIKHLSGFEPSNYREMIKDRVVFDQNVPRALAAILAGVVLAVAGAVLQNLIRNPLADPYTLGISSGALFGMVIFVALGISLIPSSGSLDGQIFNAFIFALIPTGIVVFVSAFKKVTPTMMILCGIAVMYIFSAFNTIIKYTSDSETLSMIYHWSVGSVSGMSWGSIPKLAIASAIIIVPMWYLREHIDIVAQGDNHAITLGIDPNRLRIISLIIVSLSTAIVVCYTGTIGFVGLVSPHIARIIFGSKCRLLIPSSAVIGAIMVMGSDYLVRLMAPSLPVGVVIALICSPIFIYILIKMKKNVW